MNIHHDDSGSYLIMTGVNGEDVAYPVDILYDGNHPTLVSVESLNEATHSVTNNDGMDVIENSTVTGVMVQQEDVEHEVEVATELDEEIAPSNHDKEMDVPEAEDDPDYEPYLDRMINDMSDNSSDECEVVSVTSRNGRGTNQPSTQQVSQTTIVPAKPKVPQKKSKRPHKTLSILEKSEVLKKLEKKELAADLAKYYGVGKSTITGIKKNKEKIQAAALKLAKSKGNDDAKIVREVTNPPLGEALYKWFLQSRSLGHPVSGPIMKAKAEMFLARLGGASIKFSDGWLEKFKKRHGIRQIAFSGEKMDSDLQAAENFVKKLAKIIEEDGYTRDMLYNTDETGLCWKALPTKTLASGDERVASGFKDKKDRVTILVTSNASASVKMKLSFIGKYENPRPFKNINKKELPVHYEHQKNAWMDAKIFKNWFFKMFVPEVREKHKELNIEPKALLLLDNAAVHPNEEILKTDDGKIKALFLPPNITATHQPMDQAVIETMKRYYRKELLMKLLLRGEEEPESLKQFWQSLNILEAIYMVSNAWDKVENKTLVSAWKKLLPDNISAENNDSSTTSSESNRAPDIVNDITAIASRLPGSHECQRQDIEEWLNADDDGSGFRILTDEEIISGGVEEDDDGSSQDTDIPEVPFTSASEAVKAADTLIDYMRGQKDLSLSQLAFVKNLRDEIALKRISKFKDGKITDFFRKF